MSGAVGVCRSFDEEMGFISKCGVNEYMVKEGFVPNMVVPGRFYVNDALKNLVLEELAEYCRARRSSGNAARGGFLPALKQLANVASLPGIVRGSIALPDVHAGYGFAIGNVAAFDMGGEDSIVSPGGVGFDINCGVRLLRTNLMLSDLEGKQEALTQSLFNHIPVGVGSLGMIKCDDSDLESILGMGIDWSVMNGYAWSEDKEHCEEFGRMLTASASAVSSRAKRRGLPQLGTLGAGNHYSEVQVVEEIYDERAAKALGIHSKNQVCVMIHSGSRGLGHQVATDALVEMERASQRLGIKLNDPQLACVPIRSAEGKKYLAGMSAAANYAWVNRSSMTFLVRQAFSRIFGQSPDDLDMNVIYDVSHNIAKVEQHLVDGVPKQLLVHRKGSTRAFPPNHPSIPSGYQTIGQPVLIGGTMGTNSYILLGTDKAFRDTWGSTCHGAGRALSRNRSRNNLSYEQVLQKLADQKISIRVASPKLVMEESPESYKDVNAVADTCHEAGISMKCVKLRPVAVIKG